MNCNSDLMGCWPVLIDFDYQSQADASEEGAATSEKFILNSVTVGEIEIEPKAFAAHEQSKWLRACADEYAKQMEIA